MTEREYWSGSLFVRQQVHHHHQIMHFCATVYDFLHCQSFVNDYANAQKLPNPHAIPMFTDVCVYA